MHIFYGNCIFFLVLLVSCDSLYRESKIVFQDNGFSNVLVAIHDSVTNETIVDKIKETFTNASAVLYKATKKRAYFKEIVILIPSTWKNIPGISPAAAGETLQYADIVVSGPAPTHRNYPFTRSYAGCGQHGIHMQLSSDVFFNLFEPRVVPPVKAAPDKLIVHEWGTFRWGVFQEYPSDGENQFYFSTQFGRPDPIRCSLGLLGRISAKFSNGSTITCNPTNPIYHDPDTGLMKPYCKFLQYPYHNRGYESMMDIQWVKEITDFCDDHVDYAHNKFGHNFEPPNLHNRLCAHRSTLSVILDTRDFRGGKNQPRDGLDTTPTFRIIKAPTNKRAAIYLEDGDFGSLQMAEHILGTLHHDTEVDIVDKSQNIIQKLTKRDTYHRKVKIQGQTPNKLDHVVVIGCQQPINITFKRTTKVHNTNCHELPDKKSLFEVSHFMNEGDRPTYVYYHQFSARKGMIHKDVFMVDESIDDLVLAVYYTGNTEPLATLTSPSGKTTKEFTLDTEMQSLSTVFQTVEKGQWNLRISSTNLEMQNISIYIFASMDNSNMPKISLTAKSIYLPYHSDYRLAVFAEVSQGHHSVLGLNVTAKILTEDDQVEQTLLFDNGAGADIHKGDGIYSRFLPYHKTHDQQITIKAYDSRNEAYIANISLVCTEDDEEEDSCSPVKERKETPFRFGLSRVTQITIPRKKKRSRRETVNTVLPPARIHDLVSHGMDENGIITLTFTATGDDLDHGKANNYILLYSHKSEEIFNTKEPIQDLKHVPQAALLIGNLTDPKSFGHTEMFQIDSKALPTAIKNSFAFVVYAIDKDGNIGKMSNLVTAGRV